MSGRIDKDEAGGFMRYNLTNEAPRTDQSQLCYLHPTKKT
jgi:hypothetical protein